MDTTGNKSPKKENPVTTEYSSKSNRQNQDNIANNKEQLKYSEKEPKHETPTKVLHSPSSSTTSPKCTINSPENPNSHFSRLKKFCGQFMQWKDKNITRPEYASSAVLTNPSTSTETVAIDLINKVTYFSKQPIVPQFSIGHAQMAMSCIDRSERKEHVEFGQLGEVSAVSDFGAPPRVDEKQNDVSVSSDTTSSSSNMPSTSSTEEYSDIPNDPEVSRLSTNQHSKVTSQAEKNVKYNYSTSSSLSGELPAAWAENILKQSTETNHVSATEKKPGEHGILKKQNTATDNGNKAVTFGYAMVRRISPVRGYPPNRSSSPINIPNMNNNKQRPTKERTRRYGADDEDPPVVFYRRNYYKNSILEFENPLADAITEQCSSQLALPIEQKIVKVDREKLNILRSISIPFEVLSDSTNEETGQDEDNFSGSSEKDIEASSSRESIHFSSVDASPVIATEESGQRFDDKKRCISLKPKSAKYVPQLQKRLKKRKSISSYRSKNIPHQTWENNKPSTSSGSVEEFLSHHKYKRFSKIQNKELPVSDVRVKASKVLGLLVASLANSLAATSTSDSNFDKRTKSGGTKSFSKRSKPIPIPQSNYKSGNPKTRRKRSFPRSKPSPSVGPQDHDKCERLFKVEGDNKISVNPIKFCDDKQAFGETLLTNRESGKISAPTREDLPNKEEDALSSLEKQPSTFIGNSSGYENLLSLSQQCIQTSFTEEDNLIKEERGKFANKTEVLEDTKFPTYKESSRCTFKDKLPIDMKSDHISTNQSSTLSGNRADSEKLYSVGQTDHQQLFKVEDDITKDDYNKQFVSTTEGRLEAMSSPNTQSAWKNTEAKAESHDRNDGLEVLENQLSTFSGNQTNNNRHRSVGQPDHQKLYKVESELTKEDDSKKYTNNIEILEDQIPSLCSEDMLPLDLLRKWTNTKGNNQSSSSSSEEELPPLTHKDASDDGEDSSLVLENQSPMLSGDSSPEEFQGILQNKNTSTSADANVSNLNSSTTVKESPCPICVRQLQRSENFNNFTFSSLRSSPPPTYSDILSGKRESTPYTITAKAVVNDTSFAGVNFLEEFREILKLRNPTNAPPDMEIRLIKNVCKHHLESLAAVESPIYVNVHPSDDVSSGSSDNNNYETSTSECTILGNSNVDCLNLQYINSEPAFGVQTEINTEKHKMETDL